MSRLCYFVLEVETCHISDIAHSQKIKIDKEQKKNTARHPIRLRAFGLRNGAVSKTRPAQSMGHLYQAFGIKEIRHAWKKQWAAQELNAV
jgi:hypothetical protein